eukprot:6196471-Pleurochrysis_carterae.AAC.1
MRRSLQQGKTKSCQSPSQLKIVKHQGICHSNQASVACEESPLKFRERDARPSRAEKVVFGQSPCENGLITSARKSRKSERQKDLTEVSGKSGGQNRDGGGREKTGRARRRRRR